jgi:ketosteroid isomerase-like protein
MNGVLMVSPAVNPVSSPLPDAQFAVNLHNKQIDDVLGLYTADAVFVNPDGSVAHAGPELRTLYEQVTGSFDSEMHLSPKKARQVGPNVVVSGNYKETLRHRNTGKVHVVKGRYLFVGHKEEDGVYRYSRMEWH